MNKSVLETGLRRSLHPQPNFLVAQYREALAQQQPVPNM
jgi:hypothetical protein